MGRQQLLAAVARAVPKSAWPLPVPRWGFQPGCKWHPSPHRYLERGVAVPARHSCSGLRKLCCPATQAAAAGIGSSVCSGAPPHCLTSHAATKSCFFPLWLPPGFFPMIGPECRVHCWPYRGFARAPSPCRGGAYVYASLGLFSRQIACTVLQGPHSTLVSVFVFSGKHCIVYAHSYCLDPDGAAGLQPPQDRTVANSCDVVGSCMHAACVGSRSCQPCGRWLESKRQAATRAGCFWACPAIWFACSWHATFPKDLRDLWG